MGSNRSRLHFLSTLALLGGLTLGVGALTAGCGGSATPPAPTPDTSAPPPPPPPPPIPVSNQVQEPTAADVAAARPKTVVDPFTLPTLKSGTAAVAVNPEGGPNGKTHGLKPGEKGGPKVPSGTKSPTPVPSPPTPPNFQAVGIFGGSHGPVAILAPGGGGHGGGGASAGAPGTIIVTTGTKLDDGGFVKSIDPASRKVVIDKENTDFVLPLEAPAGPSSATGK